MIFEYIQLVLQCFSMPLLYIAVLWFGILGYFVEVFVTMLITKSNWSKVTPVLFRLHGVGLVSSYFLTPICVILTISLQKRLDSVFDGNIANYSLFIWFAINMINMIFIMKFMVCRVFASISCRLWDLSMMLAYVGITILGIILFHKFM